MCKRECSIVPTKREKPQIPDTIPEHPHRLNPFKLSCSLQSKSIYIEHSYDSSVNNLFNDDHCLSPLVTVVKRRAGKLLFCCSVVFCDCFHAFSLDICKTVKSCSSSRLRKKLARTDLYSWYDKLVSRHTSSENERLQTGERVKLPAAVKLMIINR